MVGQARAVGRIPSHAAVGYAVFALWAVAPLAVGFGVVATRLVRPDSFAVALGTTAVVALLGGVVSTAILRRRFAAAVPPAERHDPPDPGGL